MLSGIEMFTFFVSDHLNNPFEIIRPDGIRVHIKAIKIIMEKFQRRS